MKNMHIALGITCSLVSSAFAASKPESPIAIIVDPANNTIARYLHIPKIGNGIMLVDPEGKDVGGILIRDSTGDLEHFYLTSDGKVTTFYNKNNMHLGKGATFVLPKSKDKTLKTPVLIKNKKTGEGIALLDRISFFKPNETYGIFLNLKEGKSDEGVFLFVDSALSSFWVNRNANGKARIQVSTLHANKAGMPPF